MTRVWLFALSGNVEIERRARSLLSDAELRRASAFRFDHHRRRFLVRRAMRRLLLAELLGEAPEELAFGQNEHGKPYLDGTGAGIFFNASHSVDCGVVVAGDRPLGVDIESLDRNIDHADFATRCFVEQEAREIVGRSGDERVTAFFNCWTAKEAYIKGLGVGLTKGLQTFEVRCSPEAPPGLISDQEYPSHPSNWQFLRLGDGGHIVTVAVEGSAETGKPQIYSLSDESLLAGRAIDLPGRSSWHEC